MSDTPDVLDALAERLHQWVHACPGDGTCGSMACHVGYYTFIEHAAACDLLAFFDERGEAVVKAPGLSHGDELVRVDGLRVTGTQDAPTFNQEPVWRRLRRSVPERRCSTCDGRKVVEGHAWRRIDETTGFPARELVPCPACSVPENGDTQ